MKRFAQGLVVGKFSPLHLGHEQVIRRALDECERVALISYSKPEFPGCDAQRRERWLRTRFPSAQILVLDDVRLRVLLELATRWPLLPDNDAPDHVHQAFCAELCSDVLRVRVDAVYSSEHYGQPFAAALTRHFRSAGIDGPDVRSVVVDPDRRIVPISGSQLRGEPSRLRNWVAPEVAASFVQRICLLGGESSGKTTLAVALAARLHTVFAAEYGRELWVERKGVLTFPDLLHIARTQIDREDALLSQADRYLFCDTSPLTTLFYSLDQFGRADDELWRLAERSYDLVILCAPDFPFQQDGTRRDAAFRARQEAWYTDQLNARGIGPLIARGSIETRCQTVLSALEIGFLLTRSS